ncbi:MAG: hypothetical protein ACYDDU_10010 [Dermatophilaceae bacterium]
MIAFGNCSASRSMAFWPRWEDPLSTTQNTCVAEAYGSQVTTWATQGCEGLDAGGGPRTGGPYIHLHLT